MPILRGGFAVFISHFGLDADDKSLLRLVCKEFKEQVDLSMRHIQPQQISSANDLSRFKNVRHLDISKAPTYTTEDALRFCPSVVEITCHPAQLKTESLAANKQLRSLAVLKNHGQPPDMQQLAAWKLSDYSVEFAREYNLPRAFVNGLKSLELAGYSKASISPELLAAICASPALKVLKLRHCLNSMRAPLRTIAAMRGQLTQLDVSYNLRNQDLAAEDFLCLNALTSLRSLNVSFTRVSSHNLVNLTCLTALQELQASACEVYPQHIGVLAKNLTRLTCLDVSSSWYLTDFGRDLSPDSFPQLHCLLLNYSAKLTALGPLTAVGELSLAGTPVSLPLLEAVGHLTSLTKLDLSCYSPSNGLQSEHMTALTRLTALQSLNLGGAALLSDPGLQLLTNLPALTELDLTWCGISTEGIGLLSRLLSLSKLKCSRCPQVDSNQVRDARLRVCLYKGHRTEEGQAQVLL